MNFPTRKLRRVTTLIAGWASILLGIAGIFLPILPGFAFLFVGLGLLSSEYRWAHTMLKRIKERFAGQGRQGCRQLSSERQARTQRRELAARE